ncbi:MAG: hypothetical protein K0R23_519 [Lacrimispora sp.]|jgi:hypothetical protein|nr:hypothetical protein [Lacrimispora sp.]
MDNDKWLVQGDDRVSLAKLNAANEFTEKFGLKLSEEDGELLLTERKNILKKQERVEFGEGILPKLIFAFCDSPYIYQDNYTDTLGRLQEIFYMYKNETLDDIPDDELIEFMKEQFDGSCQGSVDYLEDTSLAAFARESRFGLHDLREEDDEI